MSNLIDIGNDHFINYFCWSPDRSIQSNAEKFKDIPDIKIMGIHIYHKTKDNCNCMSGIYFDVPGSKDVLKDDRYLWHVESFDPLTISPSILCMICNDHGFIKEGKWVKA